MGLRIGVAGAGVMGEHHCRTLCLLKEVEAVAVFDIDPGQAQRIRKKYPVTIFPSYEQLLAAVDAVIIATPATTHAALVLEAIQKKKHLFVEKPFVPNVRDALQIYHSLQRLSHPLVVKIGFIERHNPAIQQLMQMLQPSQMESFFAQRLGAPPRTIEADVIMDVMIHDLDILLQLQRGEIRSVQAAGRRVNQIIEEAFVLITFTDQCRASLWASRRSPYKVRQLQINEKRRTFLIDYGRRTLQLYHSPLSFSRDYSLENVEERVGLAYGDPLFNELQEFIQAILQPTSHLQDVQDTIRVIRLVETIRNLIE